MKKRSFLLNGTTASAVTVMVATPLLSVDRSRGGQRVHADDVGALRGQPDDMRTALAPTYAGDAGNFAVEPPHRTPPGTVTWRQYPSLDADGTELSTTRNLPYPADECSREEHETPLHPRGLSSTLQRRQPSVFCQVPAGQIAVTPAIRVSRNAATRRSLSSVICSSESAFCQHIRDTRGEALKVAGELSDVRALIPPVLGTDMSGRRGHGGTRMDRQRCGGTWPERVRSAAIRSAKASTRVATMNDSRASPFAADAVNGDPRADPACLCQHRGEPTGDESQEHPA